VRERRDREITAFLYCAFCSTVLAVLRTYNALLFMRPVVSHTQLFIAGMLCRCLVQTELECHWRRSPPSGGCMTPCWCCRHSRRRTRMFSPTLSCLRKMRRSSVRRSLVHTSYHQQYLVRSGSKELPVVFVVMCQWRTDCHLNPGVLQVALIAEHMYAPCAYQHECVRVSRTVCAVLLEMILRHNELSTHWHILAPQVPRGFSALDLEPLLKRHYDRFTSEMYYHSHYYYHVKLVE
jgi:hypothetical protein